MAQAKSTTEKPAVDAEKAAATNIGAETVDRIRALNEKVLNRGKGAGAYWLDNYEKALESVLAFEGKAADATQVEWVAALAKVHTDLVTDVTNAYAKAARDLVG